MIVLVAGAHGRLGSRVVALLLRRRYFVRALEREIGDRLREAMVGLAVIS